MSSKSRETTFATEAPSYKERLSRYDALRFLKRTTEYEHCLPSDDFIGKIEDIYSKANTEENIAYRPFEIFWSPPYEPQHTKLLEYFINPREGHGCGEKLLALLFNYLGVELPVDRQCEVVSEAPIHYDGNKGSMDILITREVRNERYAVILENKVNDAGDTQKQLFKYVGYLKETRKFHSNEIYVFYLPLCKGKKPSDDSLGGIDKDGSVKTFGVKTFKDHIIPWLDAACGCNLIVEGMRNNIKHYRDLIKFLVNEDIKATMSARILQQLELADNNKKLPTWSQVNNLQESTVALKSCMESVLRGKLLMTIRRIFEARGIKTEWYLTDGSEGTAELCSISSEFDERFKREVDLCILVNDAVDAVRVCIGAYAASEPTETFWIGYQRVGPEDKQEAIQSTVLHVANEFFPGPWCDNPPWYKYGYREGITYANASDEATVCGLVEELVEMRDSLAAQLKLSIPRNHGVCQ